MAVSDRPATPAPRAGVARDAGTSRATEPDVVTTALKAKEQILQGRELGRGNRGWIFAAVWLAYLIPTFQSAYDLDSLPRRITGLVLVAVFGVGYVVIFIAARGSRRGSRPLRRSLQLGLLTAMAALTVVTCIVVGQPGTALAVYLAVTAMLLLEWREAWAATGAIILAVGVSDRVVSGWTVDDSTVFSIFLAALAVWGITQMIVRNVQLAVAHDEIARLAVAQERTRFARDMHDLLGHSLTVVTVKAELAGRLVSIDPERAEREINDVERLARDALADVRAAVDGYREISLAKELVSARAALEAAGIRAEVPGALDDVPGERRELFGWAVREGVTNVLRHSGARHCRIHVTREAIEIVDDGCGPVTTDLAPGVRGDGEAATGNGLTGLRERAATLGSRVSVGRASSDGGFRLMVTW